MIQPHCKNNSTVGLSAECYNQTKIADVVIKSENQCTGKSNNWILTGKPSQAKRQNFTQDRTRVNSSSADECFDVQPANCIQIFVSTPGTYRSQLLHQDEVDLAGMCEQRQNCSLFSRNGFYESFQMTDNDMSHIYYPLFRTLPDKPGFRKQEPRKVRATITLAMLRWIGLWIFLIWALLSKWAKTNHAG